MKAIKKLSLYKNSLLILANNLYVRSHPLVKLEEPNIKLKTTLRPFEDDPLHIKVLQL
jgi:hypothetical protein